MFWTVISLLQIVSLRPIFKFVPDQFHCLIPLVILSSVAVAFLAYNKKLELPFLEKPGFLIVLFMCMCGINYFLYPVADGLKLQQRGSDEDDALIDATFDLLSGRNPYEQQTYFGNPKSPGPGWIILVLPFVVAKVYFLLTPLSALVNALFVKKITGSYRNANLFIFLLMTSLGFWETMIVGSDLWAIGFSLAITLMLLFEYSSSRLSRIVIGTLSAFVCSSRIVFAYLIPVMSIFLYKRDKKAGTEFLLTGATTLLALHGIFFYWDPELYSPLHLLTKGNNLMAWHHKWGCVIVTAAGLLYVICSAVNQIESWLKCLFITLFIPLAFTSWSDLVSRNYSFSECLGSNYLIVTIPVLLTLVCLQRE